MPKIALDTEIFVAQAFLWAMKKLSRILSITGFSILSGLFGLGVTWLVAAIFFLGNNDARLVKIMPWLWIGGIIGCGIGATVALRTAKVENQATEAITNKYVGKGGRMKIYFGAPIFATAIFVMLSGEGLLKSFGPSIGAYALLGLFLLNIGISLFLYDRIPQTLVIPVGIIGWLLAILLAVWYFCGGPGAFGHSHF